jgi:tRNA uridine 5-carbamoylmethylation protein Kti12
MENLLEKQEGNNANTVLAFRCSDEESRYRVDLIAELINMYEHPENSNDEWKKAIIEVAREKGYGNVC